MSADIRVEQGNIRLTDCPKNFDRRSDLTYQMRAMTTDGDGATEEKTSTISYKFKSEGTTAVGSCDFQVIHGEIDTTNDAGRSSHAFKYTSRN